MAVIQVILGFAIVLAIVGFAFAVVRRMTQVLLMPFRKKNAAKAASDAPQPWPAHIPKLYPNLNTDQLLHFLTKEEYERILRLRRVTITPFHDPQASPDEKHFGIGLQLLMIRDLRLHRDLTVLGPEDTPSHSIFEWDLDAPELRNVSLIGGTVRFEDKRFRGYFQLVEGGSSVKLQVEDEDFQRFLVECRRGLLALLDVEASETLSGYWQTGRPVKAQDLIATGEIAFLTRGPADRAIGPRSARAVELFHANPNFVLPLHLAEDESHISEEDFLLAFARDPYDVHLQFQITCRIWTAKKSDLATFQFVRQAIELSPGHGKAHMVANNSAPESANLYYHSELGYRLLPDNTFALSNHLLYLLRRKMVPDDLSIAYKGVELDPDHIQPYWQGITLLKMAHHDAEALALALELKKVVTPPLSERTIYCITQNPQRAAEWKAGTYNPLRDVNDEIARLEAKLAQADAK